MTLIKVLRAPCIICSLKYIILVCFVTKTGIFQVNTQSTKNEGLKVPKMKVVGSANRVDPDEMASNEPPHLNLHSLTSNL